MSSSNLSDGSEKSSVNSNLASSIVHKPFSTGKINIFNPYRSKPNNQLAAPKLFLDAELEKTQQPEAILENEEQKKDWLDSILSPWGLSAIAIIFLANLISSAVIWRNSAISVNNQQISPKAPVVGNSNLAAQKFMPLSLNTLSTIDTSVNSVKKSPAQEIVPDVTLNGAMALSQINSQYHYVLTEYTGDRSLSIARQKIKNVSLVNFPQGIFIYLGAFTERSQADAFAGQLKQDGIDAYIYPLD
jgi:hypothetical protein